MLRYRVCVGEVGPKEVSLDMCEDHGLLLMFGLLAVLMILAKHLQRFGVIAVIRLEQIVHLESRMVCQSMSGSAHSNLLFEIGSSFLGMLMNRKTISQGNWGRKLKY